MDGIGGTCGNKKDTGLQIGPVYTGVHFRD